HGLLCLSGTARNHPASPLDSRHAVLIPPRGGGTPMCRSRDRRCGSIRRIFVPLWGWGAADSEPKGEGSARRKRRGLLVSALLRQPGGLQTFRPDGIEVDPDNLAVPERPQIAAEGLDFRFALARTHVVADQH